MIERQFCVDKIRRLCVGQMKVYGLVLLFLNMLKICLIRIKMFPVVSTSKLLGARHKIHHIIKKGRYIKNRGEESCRGIYLICKHLVSAS